MVRGKGSFGWLGFCFKFFYLVSVGLVYELRVRNIDFLENYDEKKFEGNVGR